MHQRCKLLIFSREGAVLRFGLAQGAVMPAAQGAVPPTGDSAEGRAGEMAVVLAPLPNLLGIDQDLEHFAEQTLGLSQPVIQGKFVARPHPQGWLYYLLEANATTAPATLHWFTPAQALGLLAQEDKKALALAIRHLSQAAT